MFKLLECAVLQAGNRSRSLAEAVRFVRLTVIYGGLAAAAQPLLAGASLPDSLKASMRKAGIPAEAVALAAGPVDRNGPLPLRFGADRAVNPASVMKLVTTYAAIDVLGPTYTWRTRFLTDAVPSGGLLRGNLYIRGDGDPKFVLERILATFQALHDTGITVVHGDIVLDQGAFEVPQKDPAQFDGESLRPYNATPQALLVNFKSVILNFMPDAATGVTRVTSEPPLAGVAVDTTVPSGKGACGDWRAALQARFDRPDAIRFVGTYPTKCGDRAWPVAYIDPDSYAERAIEGLWRASGGLLTGRVRQGGVPTAARVVYEAPSLPLSDIVADVNKFSNNVMAQQVFLTLGRLPLEAADGAGSPVIPMAPGGTGSFDRARAFVDRWWRKRLGAAPPPVLENGSGLSRQERVTADGLVALLRDASGHPNGEVLAQSLPVVGVDGTAARMADRGIVRQAVGNARVKTGTLRDVIAVAGYAQTASGKPWVVVGIINHPNASQARPVLDALLEWVATQGK